MSWRSAGALPYANQFSCAQGSDELVTGTDGQLRFSDTFEQLISIKASQLHVAVIDSIESLRKVRCSKPDLLFDSFDSLLLKISCVRLCQCSQGLTCRFWTEAACLIF
jgi:hypothetical protein